jgi:hypothetical protein
VSVLRDEGLIYTVPTRGSYVTDVLTTDQPTDEETGTY